MIIIAILTLSAGILLHLWLYRCVREKGGQIFRFYRMVLLFLVNAVLLSRVAGAAIPQFIVTTAFSLCFSFLIVEALAGRFWEKVGYGTLGVLYLFLGGYLYTIGQMPYGAVPFGAISVNQPAALIAENYPLEWVTGLPLNAAPNVDPAKMQSGRPPAPVSYAKVERLDPMRLQWGDLDRLINLDSHIRQSLLDLRQHQERELSETLAGLNEGSVHGTDMRRNAISRENVEGLLRDGAISRARYQTFLETWALADRDENAFRDRQSQERFQRLLDLLEDKEITESHRVELIRFMTLKFSQDVRIVQPLIRLYDSLDRDYPRQRRLNQEFLTLYIQRREAILEGFSRIGAASIQPLLDYRRREVAEIHYSQVALDLFLSERFGVGIQPLYLQVDPLSVHNFLNREKYPLLGKVSGAAYDQDYLRRNLRKIEAENRLPELDASPMALSAERSDQIRQALANHDRMSVDQLMIDADPSVRAGLAWQLAIAKDPRTIPLIFELMADVHPEVRRLAAVASGNFRIHDSQGARDPKFREIVRMLVNFRTNADAFARAFALSSLATVADRQKALYVLDLVLNDGATGHSLLGESAPSWSDDQEREAVHGLIGILSATPDEVFVKTHALKVLLAMNHPDSLGILMHYLRKVYADTGSRPSMLHFIVPHMTFPQEAENAEDVISDFARRYRMAPEPLHQPLKVLRANLSDFYKGYESAQFFQTLQFLEAFDEAEYQNYLFETREHVLLMRIIEYSRSTWGFWLVFWPLSILFLLGVQYGLGFFMSIGGDGPKTIPNRYANPATDLRSRRQAPASAILPVSIGRKNG